MSTMITVEHNFTESELMHL